MDLFIILLKKLFGSVYDSIEICFFESFIFIAERSVCFCLIKKIELVVESCNVCHRKRIEILHGFHIIRWYKICFIVERYTFDIEKIVECIGFVWLACIVDIEYFIVEFM